MAADMLQLFVTSLCISLVTFGGGSQALFYQFGVVKSHWISTTDLSAILAFGYATPGPAVFGTATFIGYHIAGVTGAIIGTIGIFIVPFILSVVATRHFSFLLQNTYADSALVGLSVAVTGLLIATATAFIDMGAGRQYLQLAIAGVVALLCVKRKASPLLLLALGLAAGYII